MLKAATNGGVKFDMVNPGKIAIALIDTVLHSYTDALSLVGHPESRSTTRDGACPVSNENERKT
jgi:hypothetical protein